MLIGVDGLEWSVLRPLLQNRRMPVLRGLLERGAGGLLYTLKPALSPAIWTSVATGVRPERHGILNFISPSGVPYTSNCRRGRALWNITGLYGLKTLCVGWWMTWPAERIDGWMVAPYSSAGQDNQNWKGNLREGLEGQTWPPELIDEVYPFAQRLLDKKNFATIDRPFFGDVDVSKLDDEERRLIAQTRWSVFADTVFSSVARHLLEKSEITPDLTMVYFGGTDVASHRFWRYRVPGAYKYPVAPASIKELHDIIPRFYASADRMIGEVLDAAPPDANIIICSDHGFHAGFRRSRDPSGMSAHHLDGPPGVVIMAGPDIRHGVGRDAILNPSSTRPLPRLGRILEVAPLVLYLLDIPRARRMDVPDGGSLVRRTIRKELLARRSPGATVETHNKGFRPPSQPRTVSVSATNDIKQWMAELGYTAPEAQAGTFEEVLPDKRK